MTQQYIQKVLDGDTEAFRFIIREHKDRAYTLAISVVKDEFTAREVVQSAFIQVYAKLHTFRGDARFSSWLHRIVINEAFKKASKDNRNHTPLDTVAPGEINPEENETLAQMDVDYRRYYINKALQQLSAKYSLSLRLFYLEEYDLKGISEVTGWSNANVKVILHRARNRMKELLTNEFNIDKEELF